MRYRRQGQLVPDGPNRPSRQRPVLRTLLSALAGLLMLAGCAGPGDHPASDHEPTAAPAPSPGPSATGRPALKLVAIGDSIPFNAALDCPGCTGFVERYATALEHATQRPVETNNLSEHTGLTLPGLMAELPVYKPDLTNADAIVVGIAHNSNVLNEDTPCGTPFNETTSTLEDWSKVTHACAATSADRYRRQFDKLYGTIAAWRAGRSTVLLTINKYNDWIGLKAAHLTGSQQRQTIWVHDAWNRMICRSAEQHGFTCVDVYHAFNGPQGTESPGSLLADDYTHPSNSGNALIAELLIDKGFDPLLRR
ncbi:SGNH/GDSL hydrolase family protein [Microlunatus elymi]|nr:SGNH/GDSL hydrolase family protein [Microlunatus elymi]